MTKEQIGQAIAETRKAQGINDEDALNDLNNMLKDIEQTIATIRNEFNISNQ